MRLRLDIDENDLKWLFDKFGFILAGLEDIIKNGDIKDDFTLLVQKAMRNIFELKKKIDLDDENDEKKL